MSDSLLVFTGFRQRRLQSLAARFSLVPAEVWAGQDLLASLFHEQLTQGRRFTLPIHATFRFTAESAASAAETLALTSRDGVLAALAADFDDPDYLTAWELIENAAYSLALLAPVSSVGREAEGIAGRLAAEMHQMPGADPSTPIDDLAAGIAKALAEWSAAAPSCTPGEARLLFLGMLFRHVLAAFPAPAIFWSILLLKFELAIASLPSSRALAQLLAPAFRTAWAALPLQPSLLAFWKIHGSANRADLAVAERITMLTVLARAGGSAATQLRAAISPEWVAATPASDLCEPAATWRSTLAQGLELAAYKPLHEAADHWRRLTTVAAAIPSTLQCHTDALRKIADDLAQGMPGKDTADQFVTLASELLARGLWISTVTSNPAEAREFFLQSAVRELGLDTASGLWKKLGRLSSALQQHAAAQPAGLPWSGLAALLRALEARATEIKSLPLRWSRRIPADTFEGLPFASADGPKRCARDIDHLLCRLAIEHRIHGPQRGNTDLSRWYATHVLPYLSYLPDENFRERWDILAESGFSPAPEHASLNLAARRFGENLARLTAAWKIELHVEDISRAISDEVMLALPDYAEKVGPAGRVSCARDNALTLRQISSLLLSDTSAPHEILGEWWNSAVGNYIATRPARLFETNLNAIYHALNHHLDKDEVVAAFTPIQLVYRENLGVECLESLTGAPTPITGPLARRLSHGVAPLSADRERDTLADCLRVTLAKRSFVLPKTHEALLNAFLTYHRERWTSGDTDTAAARILPLLAHSVFSARRSELAAALFEAIAAPQSAEAAPAFLLAESADGFALALGQAGVAAALVEHAPNIAREYSQAMVLYAADHFKHLEPADAVARCTRDQTLLLRNLGERLSRTAPGLFWIDATRWFLELLSPYVSYPAHVWALSARTVAKHLGHFLDPLENIFLARWVSHFEHIARGWAVSHPLAKKVFTPTNYSFSARTGEDRLQRDLLAAAFTAHYAPAEGPWSGSALFNRFLLSWPASTRSAAEIATLLNNITTVAGPALPPGLSAWLALVPERLATLTAALDSSAAERIAVTASVESTRALALAAAPSALGLWQQLRAQPAADAPPQVVACAALRAHLLHPLSEKHPRALASTFPAAARARAGLAAACIGKTTTASAWLALANALMPSASSAHEANRLRSHFTTLAHEWPAVQSGIALAATASRHADQLLTALEGGRDLPYSAPTGGKCDHSTNALAFGYAFRQTGAAAWDSAASAPRLFFGYAADNHRLLDIGVAANAHVRVHAALRAALPASPALAGDAVLGIEAPLFPATGPLWRAVALAPGAATPDYVTVLFGAIRPLADYAADYAAKGDSARRAALAERLCYHLEALVCGLEESGDFEAAWELLLARLAPDLSDLAPDLLISAYYGLTRDLSAHLAAGPAVFWRAFFVFTLEVVRQAALGHHILRHAEELARDYAASAVKSDSDERRKCARDQYHLLSSLGHLLFTQAPVRAWLNLSSHLAELTLPHISHGAVELAAAWCRHEEVLAPRLAPCLRPAAWTWLGALQRMARNLPALRPFTATAIPALADAFAARHGDTPSDWRRFLAALAASSATPDEGPVPGFALLEKLLLSSPLGRVHGPSAWPAIAEAIGRECETALPGRVPNSLKRRLLAIPALAERLEALASGEGSRLVRACATQAAHPAARPLWQASLLARCRPDERLIESDPADARAASAFGLSLEADEAILSRYSALQASRGAGASLPLAPTKSGGLLSKLGLGKKTFDWINNEGLRIEATYVLELLTLLSVLGREDSAHSWYWACPRTIDAVHPGKESGTLEFYHALAASAARQLGASHPGAAALARFAEDLSARLAGLKLALPAKPATGPIPLHLLGLRVAADVPAYIHLAPLAPDLPTRLAGHARAQGCALTEAQTALVQRAQAELLRSVS
jgi:hypothetical protein